MFVSGNPFSGNGANVVTNLVVDKFKDFAVQASINLIEKLDLAPELTDAIKLTSGALINGVWSGDIGKAFVRIAPKLVTGLAQYGITELGSSFGIDSRLTNLISAPITGLVGAVTTGQNIMDAVNRGLTGGIVKYGVNFIGNSSPILGSLLSQDVVHNIELAIGRDGLFKGIFNIVKNSALNVFNVVGGTAQSVFQGISNFGSLIQKKGLINALESLAVSAFSRSAQEVIVQKGGVQGLFDSTPLVSTNLPNGNSAKELKIDGENSLYFDDVSHLIGRKNEGVYQLGDFGYDSSGDFSLLQGNVFSDLSDDLDFSAGVKDGQLTNIKIDGPSGTLLQVDPEKPNAPIFIEGPKSQQSNLSFNFWNAAFNMIPYGLKLLIGEGVANAAEVAVGTASQVAGQLIDIALLNGFSLGEVHPNGTIPAYFESGSPFRGKLNEVGVVDTAIKPVTLYESSKTDFGQYLFLKGEYQKVLNAFIAIRNNQPNKEFVPLAYSGGARALFPAFSESMYNGFGIKTAVLVGAPMIQTDVHSGPLERIINIYGSEDMFLTGAPPIAKRFTHDQHSLETINIELQGIKHNDKGSYFYTDLKDATPEQIKASNFIARVAQASLDNASLTRFFNDLEQRIGNPTRESYTDPTTHITHTIKTYNVDWSKLPENF